MRFVRIYRRNEEKMKLGGQFIYFYSAEDEGEKELLP